jgi:hypothetical protein
MKTPFYYRAPVLFRFLPMALLCTAIAASLFFSCGRGPFAAGGGSGTGAGNGTVTGMVIFPDSTPVVGAVVRLRTQSYLADTSGKTSLVRSGILCNTTTDSLGNFRVDSVDTGISYFIEVSDYNKTARATLYKKHVLALDTVATRIVLPVAKINGTVTVSGLPANAYVQIYGLERLCRTDSAGRFEINDLPVGKCEEGECEYRVRFLIPGAGGGYTVRESELELSAGGTVTLDE